MHSFLLSWVRLPTCLNSFAWSCQLEWTYNWKLTCLTGYLWHKPTQCLLKYTLSTQILRTCRATQSGWVSKCVYLQSCQLVVFSVSHAKWNCQLVCSVFVQWNKVKQIVFHCQQRSQLALDQCGWIVDGVGLPIRPESCQTVENRWSKLSQSSWIRKIVAS